MIKIASHLTVTTPRRRVLDNGRMTMTNLETSPSRSCIEVSASPHLRFRATDTRHLRLQKH